MSSFNLGGVLGNIIPGLKKGLEKGLQYDIDYARLEIKAMETGNVAMQHDLDAVRKEWIKEATAGGGQIVSGMVIGIILSGGDPFAGSRHLLQKVEEKYGKP